MSRHAVGLLDTNVVIMRGRLTDPATLPAETRISAITLAELSKGALVARDPAEMARRHLTLQLAIHDWPNPLPFDGAAARSFGIVAAAFYSAGRKTLARTPDSFIAAIALAHDLPLYTANPDDFAGIPGLTVVEVAVP
jgi:predicted nucleic acid-binding protein